MALARVSVVFVEEVEPLRSKVMGLEEITGSLMEGLVEGMAGRLPIRFLAASRWTLLSAISLVLISIALIKVSKFHLWYWSSVTSFSMSKRSPLRCAFSSNVANKGGILAGMLAGVCFSGFLV